MLVRRIQEQRMMMILVKSGRDMKLCMMMFTPIELLEDRLNHLSQLLQLSVDFLM